MRSFVLTTIVIGGGIFSMLVGILDWERFMTASNAKPLVDLVGRKVARILYVALGVLLVTFGVLFAAGILKLPDRRPISLNAELPMNPGEKFG